MRGFSIVISPFSELLLGENRILFKIGIKNIQLGEMAEAKEIFTRTDQIQLKILSIIELCYFPFLVGECKKD